MGELNDPNKYQRKYQQARDRLEEADIDEEDRRAIRSYIEKKEASGDHEFSTLASYTTVLLRAAKMAHKPLTQWEDKDPQNGRYQSDYSKFMLGLKEGSLEGAKDGGYSPEYRRSFRQNLRPFFRFLDRPWYDDIEIGQPSKGKITEEDCFSSDETARMFQVADERDSAIIALWLATGQRASAIASLRLEDIEIDDKRGRFRLNPEAIGLKGAEGWRPMLWASPYVKRWYDKHPRRGDDDAPLFCCKRNGAQYSIGDPLSYEAIRRMVETVCDRAGIDSHKAQTHRFRHTAIRRMIRDGLSEQRIKFMVGWHEDSTQLARYGSLKDKTHSSDIEEHYNMEKGEDGDDEDGDDGIGVSHDNCPKCGAALSELADPAYCPSCGLPLSHSVEETERAIEGDLRDHYSEAAHEGDEDVLAGLDDAAELLEDPKIRSALVELAEEMDEE